MLKIEFDEGTHTYTVDGRVWPNVTSIINPLQDFSHVSPDVMERACQFGKAVHAMIDLDAKQNLDETSLDEPLQKVLEQFRLSMIGKAWAFVTELHVAHPLHRYCGTLDLLATDSKGRFHLVDIKTGALPPTVGAQTAAYAAAHFYGTPNKCTRWCLALTEVSYRWMKLESLTDWSLFLSCLNIFNWRKAHGH